MKKNRTETLDSEIQISKPNRKKRNSKIKRQNPPAKISTEYDDIDEELIGNENLFIGEDDVIQFDDTDDFI